MEDGGGAGGAGHRRMKSQPWKAAANGEKTGRPARIQPWSGYNHVDSAQRKLVGHAPSAPYNVRLRCTRCSPRLVDH